MKEALARARARAQNAAVVGVRRLAMKPAAATVARVPIRKLATLPGRMVARASTPDSAAARAPTPPSGSSYFAGFQPREIQQPEWEAAEPAAGLPAAAWRVVVRREERRLPARAGPVPCAGRLENRSQSRQADRSRACRQQCPATTTRLKKQSSLAEAAARPRF